MGDRLFIHGATTRVYVLGGAQGPILLTWFKFNHSMDK